MNPISNYLARLEMALCPLTPLEHAPPSDDNAVTASPAKRPRSDSPDSSPVAVSSSSSSYSSCTSSVPPSPLFSGITLSSSPTHLHPVGLSLRSILSPSSSPPGSRPLSRRSSTGCSSKSVRFARCTNASVFPAFSSGEYDRSPITPTCESESLNLPARCSAETNGWVKCVQRARKADKERKAIAAAKGLASPTTVEGVHGLVDGGYFVGDEREPVSASDDSEEVEDVSGDDGMVVDDEEEGDSDHDVEVLPQLTSDDSSSSEESDGIVSISSDTVVTPIIAATPVVSAVADDSIVVEQSELAAVPTPPMSEEEKKKMQQKCRERYGMCALGKYTRAEVFQSFDSLGGF